MSLGTDRVHQPDHQPAVREILTDLQARVPTISRIRQFLGATFADRIFFLASALSFDALLTAIPLMMLFFAVFGYIVEAYGGPSANLDIILRAILPMHGAGDPITQAEEMITAVVESRRDLSLYGIPLFLIFSIRLFASARIALDQVFGIALKPRWLHGLVRDFILVVVTTALFAANSLVAFPGLMYPWMDRLAGTTLSALSAMALFFIVYSFAPDRKLPWRTTFLAAGIAALAFEIGKYFYGGYVVRFVTVNQVISHANALALILFVFWVYITAIIFLLGGEFAKAHAHWKGDTAELPLPNARTSQVPVGHEGPS